MFDASANGTDIDGEISLHRGRPMNAKRVVSAFVLLFPLIILSHPAEGANKSGICGLRLGAQLTTGCQMAQDADLGWYRCMVRWNEIVDNDGNFNWDGLDTRLENVFAHGLRVILVFRSIHELFAPDSGLTDLGHKTVWTAAPPAPEYLEEYKAFVRQFVERYDGDGTLDAPFVNKRNKISNWGVETEPGKNPDQGSGFWNGTAADYAGLYLVAYDEIKQAYPEARVFLSAFTAQSMMYFINNGISFPSEVLRILHESGGDFDVFNLHCYWEYTSYDEIHDAASTHLGLFPEFSSKPIWLTETNVEWGQLDSNYTEEQYNAFVAKDIVKRFAIMFDRGVKKVFWFQFRDKSGTWQVPMAPEDFTRFAGLTTPDLTPKPVYYTYKLLTEKLNGRAPAERIGSDPTGWVFKFGSDYDPVYVMWSDTSPGETTQVTLSVPWEEAIISHVVTEPGITEPYVETRSVVGGSLQIDLDDSPIFVENATPTQPSGPVIDKIRPRSSDRGKIIRILGSGFGNDQGNSVIHFAKSTLDSTSPKIKYWSDTKIRVRVPKYKCHWFKGKDFRRVKVWVTVAGVDGNEKRLPVFKPDTCP